MDLSVKIGKEEWLNGKCSEVESILQDAFPAILEKKTYRCLEKNESAFSCSFNLKSWAQSSIMEQKFSGTPRPSYSEITLSESFFTLSYGNIASFFP